jgi:hypothetical protein
VKQARKPCSGHNVRSLGAGFLLASCCAVLVLAAETTTQDAPAAVDPDNVPRVVGGGSVLGGGASIAVIPYALPEIPPDTAEQVGTQSRIGTDPNLSGIYKHEARLFQNPSPSSGIGPGLATAPSPLTLLPALDTDRLGSQADYHTPLLRAWAAELVKRAGEAEAASRPYFERCIQNDGTLVMWSLGNRGLQLLQTPEKIYLFFGQDVVRVVHMNTEHPADLKPSVSGHSVGRWDGETLVIDTIGFDGTSDADRYGTPSTEQMHVVERMRLRHGGQILEIDFWVDDPLVYTQPWTSVITYARSDKLPGERVCQEGQMFPDPLGGSL